MDDFRHLVTETTSIWDLTMREWIKMVEKEVKDPKYVEHSFPSYSTTTDYDKLIAYGYIMDSTKAYFDFHCYCLCGIPRV